MRTSISFLKHVLNLAVKDGKIDRNPVCSVKFSPEPQGRLRFLSEEEIRALKGIMPPEEWAVVQFALETGLRQSEQFKARWEWADLDRGIMTIPNSKSGKTRHIPLNDGALHILKSSRTCLESPYFYRVLENQAVTGPIWHTLRHTFASRLVMAGVDIRTVQELMGHSTIVMTMRYAHLSPDHLRNAVNKVSLGNNQSGTVTKEKPSPGAGEGHMLELIDIKEEKVEVASGFEPLNDSFADCSLSHLGTPPYC